MNELKLPHLAMRPALAWVITSVIAAQLVLFPVFFAVGFPYSLTAFEVTTLGLLALATLSSALPRRHLAVLLWLTAGFLLHVVALDGDPATLWFQGSCLDEPPRASGIDTVAALDTFRRTFAYAALFVLALNLSSSPRHSGALCTAIAVAAALLLLLGVVAPRDNTNILWLFSIPTHDRYWLSSSAHPLLSDLWGYARPYQVDGIPITLDEWQVSWKPLGPMVNENQYAAAIGVTFPLLMATVARALRGRLPRGQLAILIALGSAACGLLYYATNFRGGLIAMLLSLGAFVIASRNPLKARPLLLATATGVAAICVGVPLFRVFGEVPGLGGRATIWLSTMVAFFEQPFLGSGLGSFPDLRLGYERQFFVVWYAPHNVFLHVFTEIGIAGTLWLLAAVAIIGWPPPAHHPAGDRLFIAGLLASLIFAMICGALSYPPAMPFNAAITAVAAGLLLGRIQTRIPQPSAGIPVRPWRLLQGAVVLTTAWLFVAAIQAGYSQARSFQTRDLVAWLLSRSPDRPPLQAELHRVVSRNEQECSRLPPRKDYLQSMGNANLLLATEYRDRHLRQAAAYMGRSQAIGRRSASLTESELAIARRIEIPTLPINR